MSRQVFEKVFNGCNLYENPLFSYKFVRREVLRYIHETEGPDWEINLAWFWLNKNSRGIIPWSTINLEFEGTFFLRGYLYFRILVEGEVARLLVGETRVQEIALDEEFEITT